MEKLEGFDRIFPLIGGRNLYQWILFGIFSMQAALFNLNIISYIFLAAVPEHWCEIEELRNTNWTADQIKSISIPRKSDGIGFEKCERYDLNYAELLNKTYEEAFGSIEFDTTGKIACSQWAYDKSVYLSTTVTSFDLVCERAYLVATIQATYMAGSFLGSFVLGGLSDGPLGRRGVVLIAVGFVLIGGFGAAFSTSYMSFIIFRFLIAMGVSSTYQNTFTIMMEYVDKSYRATIGIYPSIPDAIGFLVVPLFAYFIRDWSSLQLAFTTSSLVCLSYFWILPESSRWLISKGREDEAFKVVQGIAKRNRKPELKLEEIDKIFEACKNEFNERENTQKSSSCCVKICTAFKNILRNYMRLLETPELRKRSIIIWILYFSVTLVFYGVIFSSVTLSNDPYLVPFLGAVMDIGAIGIIPLVSRWGRTPTVATCFLLAGASIITIAFLPVDLFVLRVIFSLLGKLFISATYRVIYMLVTELYPTQTRATGLACASLMGRFGSMLAPFVVNGMGNVYADLPSIIFGVAGLCAGLITLLLPETKDVELLESVNAIEGIGNRVKSLRRNSEVETLEHNNEVSV